MASQACCDSGFPVSVDHVDQGEEISLDGLTVYKSGDPKTAKAGVLVGGRQLERVGEGEGKRQGKT